MTTAAPMDLPVGDISLFSSNGTTKSQEQVLYQSSGAIVAAIVTGVVVIFTVVLLLLKMYNKRMRANRELEPKNTKAMNSSPLGQNNNNGAGQDATVTFVPVDICMENRRP